MQADKYETHKVQCPHCFAQMKSDPKAKKLRCSKCNTLIQFKKKSVEELTANALECIRATAQNEETKAASTRILPPLKKN